MKTYTTSAPRLDYIDYTKALCIVLMIIGHWTFSAKIYQYIYSFHMPAFFIISGILFRQRPWRYTMVSFALPILAISIVNGLLQYLFLDLDLCNSSWLEILAGVVHYRFDTRYYFFSGDWFIWTLVTLRCLFGDIRYLAFLRQKCYYIPLAIIATIYMLLEPYIVNPDATFLKFTAERAIPCLPFFCMGLYLRDINLKPQKLSLKIITLLAVIALAFPLLNGTPDIYYNHFGNSYLLFLINAPATTLLLLWLTSYLPTSTIIKTISNGTLLIFGVNQTFIFILYKWLSFPLTLTIPLLILGICYPAIALLDRHIPILLGKWRVSASPERQQATNITQKKVFRKKMKQN